jgi:endonuclease III
MSSLFHAGIQRIANNYATNAARIWEDTPSSAEVVYRFLEFDGIGPKIATMATNILARDFKIELADHFSIDISADRQCVASFPALDYVRATHRQNRSSTKHGHFTPFFPA